MLKNLGRLIWRQPREMQVLNYAHHTVYSVYTNTGFQYFVQDKETNHVECLTGSMFDRLSKITSTNRDESVPHLWGSERVQILHTPQRLP